jgi:hypothetical protein
MILKLREDYVNGTGQIVSGGVGILTWHCLISKFKTYLPLSHFLSSTQQN